MRHGLRRGSTEALSTEASFDSDWAWPTYRLVRFVAVSFAVVVAYPYIPGSTSAAFQAVPDA
jgi:hypothetical protein